MGLIEQFTAVHETVRGTFETLRLVRRYYEIAMISSS
jgi:hypothetical protein